MIAVNTLREYLKESKPSVIAIEHCILAAGTIMSICICMSSTVQNEKHVLFMPLHRNVLFEGKFRRTIC